MIISKKKRWLSSWSAEFPVSHLDFSLALLGKARDLCALRYSPFSWPLDPNVRWISNSSLKADSLSEHHKILLFWVLISLLSHLKQKLEGPNFSLFLMLMLMVVVVMAATFHCIFTSWGHRAQVYMCTHCYSHFIGQAEALKDKEQSVDFSQGPVTWWLYD